MSHRIRIVLATLALVMIAALAAMSVRENVAHATTCDRCALNYATCMDRCTTTTCENNCGRQLDACYRHCTPDPTNPPPDDPND